MSYQTETQDSCFTEEIVKKIRILIVDDQNLICKLMPIALEAEPDLEVVGMANDGATALELAAKLQPDIALIDIEMPGIDGIETTRKFSESFLATKVVILSSHDQQEYIDAAFDAGAKGYLSKNASSEELARAIRFTDRNYVHLSQGLFQPIETKVPEVEVDLKKELDDLRKELDDDEVFNLKLISERTSGVTDSTAIVPSSSKLASFPEEDWSMATKDLLDAMPRLWTRGLFYVLVVFTGIILPWSILAKVDETGMARGKLEPKAQIVELDAPVAGTVAAIKVKEGDTVKAQQVLLELESDVIRADLQQLEEKQTGQLNRLTQLELMQNQLSLALRTQEQQNQAQELEKQAQVKQARQNLNGLQTLYLTQKQEKLAQLEQFKGAINASGANHRLAEVALAGSQKKASRYDQAFKDGIIPADRLEDIQQQAAENQERLTVAGSELEQSRDRLTEQLRNYDKLIQQTESEIEQAGLRLQEQERSYQSVVHSGKLALLKTEEQLKNLETQISDLNSEIAQGKSQIGSLNFQLTQRVLKAPASGTVFHLPISGAGAVVQSGENLVEIAPEDSPLALKANMTPTESGFLRVGMPVKIKFDAYPFQDYGVQAGKVSWISPDSKIIETAQGQQEIFELKIELERDYIEGNHQRITLTPGQTATAEVIIRQRRLIDFVLDPFKKLQKGGLEL
ncbi:MAG: response regulator [Pleurocapsa sp. SU_5_0]|nr:response regulator [Pleurocapsa sp. SU_5_0]NJO95946.1 response regulator [Pleurocapsa sp. CRU_1_2]NJR45295.1 response regulator [Hyellaceae cyanobacterium CSU_1_1]